ncbi:MAG: DUF4956 domain-containing protein [Puniceicoccaceae bacterium]|nr:MAG: DUF4956 domain-containing protein [Puniceicoccaceae bacterium]
MLESLFIGDQTNEPVRMAAVLLGLLLSFGCGQVLAWTYMATHSGLSYSRSYVNALVLMPVLVGMVMMVLSNNLITAFGLMALFAIVRFRNILRDTLDTCYILAGITLGMACGTGRYSTAVAGLLLICGILLYLSYTSFGSRQRYDMILNFHWERSVDEMKDVLQLMKSYSFRSVCASQRSHDEDMGVDLSYRLLLRDPDRMNELVRKIREYDGASRVTGLSADAESEL